jgi:PAS domain S-box-containing protein
MSEKTIRILLIEDSLSNARLVRDTLADAVQTNPDIPDFDLVRTVKLSTGLKRLAKGDIDVALLDLSLPDSQGLDAFAQVHTQAPEVPTIILSGSEDRALAIEAVREGAEDYLIKSQTSSDLMIRSIRYAVECARAEAVRQRMEEALRASEKRFRLLYENAPLAYHSLDKDGRLTKVNQAWLDMLDYSRDQVIGRWFGDFLSPEYKDEFRQAFSRFTASGTIHAEFEMVRRDGSHVAVSLDGRASGDEREDFRQTHCVIHNAARHRSLFNRMPVGMYRSTSEGQILDANPAMVRMLGYPDRESLLATNAIDLYVDAEGRTRFKECVEREGTLRDFETQLLRHDGTPVWVRLNSRAVRSADGQTFYEGTLEDITECVRTEEALRRERDLISRIMETSPAGITVVDRQGQITFANDRAEYVLGLTEDRMTQRTYNDPEWRITDYAGHPLPDEQLPFQRVMATGQPVYGVRHAIEWPGGQRILLSVSAAPLFDEAGEMDGLVATVENVTEQVQAEKELQESERRFRNIVESTPLGMHMYRLEPDGRLVFTGANPAADRILSVDNAQFVGKTIEEAFPALTQAKVPQAYRRVAITGQAWHADQITYEGGQITGAFEVHAFQTSPGKMAAAFLDIADRKQAEKALERSEATLRSIFRAAPIGIGLVKDRVFQWTNETLHRMLGYTEEELRGQSARMIYPDQEEYERVGRVKYGEIAERGTGSIETRWQRKDGQVIDILLSSTPIDPADLSKGVTFTALDTTERKRAEKEREHLLAQIQEQAQRVQQIMDTVPEGVILLDVENRVVLANPLGRRDLTLLAGTPVGGTLAQLGNRPLTELLTSPPRGLWHEVSTDAYTFQVIARPIETGPTPGGWVLVIRDVTQQREVERQIQQQERLAAVGQLAAGIAHDFNNIMAVIALYAGMSLRSPNVPHKVSERLEIIDQQARRASGLIQQIMDFSRRAVLERGPLDLLAFIKEQSKLLQRTLPESIRGNLTHVKDEYTIHADPTRIQQAIMNLATNARDAMPEGGELHITLDRIQTKDGVSPIPEMQSRDWVRVRVADTGTGIPDDVLPHIYDPFFTTKEPGKGTGLGLAQVYGIIKQHDGHIDVHTKVGEGTTFTLYLPVLSLEQPEEPQVSEERLARGTGQLILVVEDDAATRLAVASSLELLGYQVLEATNGREALTVFEAHADRVALVLSDMVMPVMGGQALFHALKQRDPAVKVLLLTGHPLREEEMEPLQAQGLSGWLLKPPSLEKLAQIVAQMLEKDGKVTNGQEP